MKTAEKKTEKRMVEVWEERMKKAGHQFAMIKTRNAIYDRVAIVADLPTILTVQYPKGASRRKNLSAAYTPCDSITIKQENISKRDIVGNIRYYKN